jgi:hypothetical protein
MQVEGEDVYEPSPVEVIVVKQVRPGPQVWRLSQAWPAPTTIGGWRCPHVPAVPPSGAKQEELPVQPTDGTAARSHASPAPSWTMVLPGVQTLVVG